VLFVQHANLALVANEREQGNGIVLHELGGNGPAGYVRKLVCAELEILFDLKCPPLATGAQQLLLWATPWLLWLCEYGTGPSTLPESPGMPRYPT
jgi:hypothetical protein